MHKNYFINVLLSININLRVYSEEKTNNFLIPFSSAFLAFPLQWKIIDILSIKKIVQSTIHL